MTLPTQGRLLVVGAGYMGSQIALQAAVAGWEVALVDPDLTALERAQAKHTLELSPGETGDARVPAGVVLSYATEIEHAAAGVDVVIEAASEQLQTKRQIFAELERFAPTDALLATNSSSLRISAIEDVATHPERLLNMHFFPPVSVRTLVELMGGTKTSEIALERARMFAKSIGMTPLMVKRPSTGFLFNRVWRAIKKECLSVVEQGVGSPEDIDRAWMIIYGADEGPFASMDAIGLDIVLGIERAYHRESGLDVDRPAEFLVEMVESGRLGVKSGRGFYRYPDPAYQAADFLGARARPGADANIGDAESVIGTWRLQAFDRRRSDGTVLERLYGEAPLGYLTYTQDGHFHINVMQGERDPFEEPLPEAGSQEERGAAFASSMGYAGRWTIRTGEEGSVMVHKVEISWFPNWSGVELERTVQVTAHELVLKADRGLPAGEEIVVVWERSEEGSSARRQ